MSENIQVMNHWYSQIIAMSTQEKKNSLSSYHLNRMGSVSTPSSWSGFSYGPTNYSNDKEESKQSIC